jgi:hypothetical protein
LVKSINEPLSELYIGYNLIVAECGESMCKVAREVVGGPRGPIVIIVEVIQCKVD